MERPFTLLAILAIFSQPLFVGVVCEQDVICHKTEGVALTMDVFIPEEPNGAAIIKIVSYGSSSSPVPKKRHLGFEYAQENFKRIQSMLAILRNRVSLRQPSLNFIESRFPRVFKR